LTLRYLIDTDILLLLRRDNTAVLERFGKIAPSSVAMSVITYGELLVGEYRSQRRRETAEEVSSLSELCPVLPLPVEAAREYGVLRAYLKDTGRLIGNNDLWIAAHALASDLTLVTANEREFRRVRGLKLQNWSKPPS
jgi:tRNA(fMet)-specific endonuclease VapC